MDSKIRLLAKAVTWQVSGLISMMLIGYLFTGSVVASGGIAVVGCFAGFVAYFVHEIAWGKVAWGRIQTPDATRWDINTKV
jgi:uncharacterized membrane protein